MSRPTWSWRHALLKSSLKPTTRHVLLTLACYMNDVGGGCYPTTAKLAEATGLSERAVCQHLAIAADAGWIRVTQVGLAGRRWKSNQYEAQWPEGADPASAPQVTSGTDRRSVPSESGTDPASVPQSHEALTVVPRGTDRRSVYLSKEHKPPSPFSRRRGNRRAGDESASREAWVPPTGYLVAKDDPALFEMAVSVSGMHHVASVKAWTFGPEVVEAARAKLSAQRERA